MKTYEVVFNEDEDKGIYAVSVVESPAMESMFIALSSDSNKVPVNIQFKDSDEAKKENTLLGVALIPDKKIYRNIEGDEFNIVFSKETIKKAAHTFLKKGYQHNSTVEHEDKIEGVSIVESWIVKDPENNTANAYNLAKEDIKEGTWIVKMKCDNEDIYNKAINGDIKGFSIDGLFSLEEVKLKSSIEMSEKTLKETLKESLDGFKAEIKALFSKEVKLMEVKTSDGVVISYEGESLEAGVEVFVMNEEDEKIPLPAGEYELEGGMTLVIEDDGVVSSVSESSEEEEIEMSDDDKNAIIEQVKEMMAQLKSEVTIDLDKVKAELSDKAKENEVLKSEIQKLETKLKEEPAQQPLRHTDKEVKLSENPSLKERLAHIKSKFN